MTFSALWRKPDRVKRAVGNKTAKILHKRQKNYSKTKSIEYKVATFIKFGAEFLFVNLFIAINKTNDYFKEYYGDNLNPKHSLLILFIKFICTDQSKESFSSKDISNSDFFLERSLGYFMDRTFINHLLGDLKRMHFLDKRGHRWVPTTRIRVFCSKFQELAEREFGVSG